MTIAHSSIAAFLLCVAASSAHAADRPNECGKKPPVASVASPQLDKGEVYAAASQAARAGGLKIEEYDTPSTCFRSPDKEWRVTYERRVFNGKRGEGDPIEIAIHDTTKKTRLVKGG